MKKKSMIILSLAIVFGILALIGGFLLFSGGTDGNNETGLSESTDISLDFSELTNGRWEYQVDSDSPEIDTWQDQIYTDSYIVNSAMTRLVPASGQRKLSGGWNETHDTYVSALGSFRLYATGLKPGAAYRVALFVPRAEGGTGLYCSMVTGQKKGEKTQVCDVDLSCYPGCYKDLTLVITGNGEIYTRTFHVQLQNVSGQTIQNRNAGHLSGLYYDTQPHTTAAYVRKDGPVSSADFTKASSGISICVPQDKDVYTGFDGAGMIECCICLDCSYDPLENRIFEVSYRLTELATGQDVCSGTARAKLGSGDGFSWLTASVMLPPVLSEGEYCLCAEIFQSDSGSEEQVTAAGVSMGTDTVTFSLQKEYSLSEIYGQYLRKELKLNLHSSQNSVWSEDNTYLTLTDTSDLEFELQGTMPGVVYRSALIQETKGGTIVTPIRLTKEKEQENTYLGVVNILPHSGEFENVTLLAYGGGESIVHTFSGEAVLPREYEKDTSGADSADSFVWKSEISELQPGSGYAVCLSEGAVASGYAGSELRIPIAFGPEYSGVQNISVCVAEANTGKVIGESSVEIRVEDLSDGTVGVTVTEDFTSGDYILLLSVGSEETELRITLEKERTPLQVYEARQSASGTMEKLSEQGVILYESTVIVPEIKEYLASMESFDTDMFNNFLRYRYVQSQDMIGSFALSAPNVSESEQVVDREDLLFTANWLLRDSYVFQTKDMKHYSDAQIIKVDQMKAFLGDSWKELAAMDYATGAARDSDGTVYIWLPVYYEDDQGGIANNTLYLFVYILHHGADTAYLDATNYYNSEFYNDYRTTKLLITDQNMVARMLNKLNRENRALFAQEDTNDYPTLYRSMEGEYVRRLQRRLQRLGYLTTSVDAVFTKSVEDAVIAWQRDMGLEESYEVTPQMQRILHDNTPYRQLLMAWLNDHHE